MNNQYMFVKFSPDKFKRMSSSVDISLDRKEKKRRRKQVKPIMKGTNYANKSLVKNLINNNLYARKSKEMTNDKK